MLPASDSYNDDVFVIANAFQKASEEDTRQVLNAMAGERTASLLKELQFFLVSSTWMLKAYPMLNARPNMNGNSINNNNQIKGGDDGGGGSGNDNDEEISNKWRETVGIIANSELLSWDHAVSSSSDDEGGGNAQGNNNGNSHGSSNGQSTPLRKPPSTSSPTASPQKQQPPAPNSKLNNSSSSSLRRDLKHGEDYFLLGPNAWLLVKEKFGSDGNEIGRPCVFHSAEDSTLAVALLDSNNGSSDKSSQGHAADQPQQQQPQQQSLVSIPPTGRFPYEKLIADLQGDNSQDTLLHPPVAQQQPQQPSTDVISDEEGDPNDLFPDPSITDEPDDMVVSGESQSVLRLLPPPEEDIVLLLPPSTNTTDGGSPPKDNNNNNNNPQDMDATDETKVDASENANANANANPAGDEEDATIVAAVVPAVVQNTPRRYGSGLGNLGNTCFMNSTLQCLAHTDPLRRYFLSGEYNQDLNRENPLGTGGELATDFAKLLANMWGTDASLERRNIFPSSNNYVSSNNNNAPTAPVVYPREFKTTLGKHAEQFVGYDQHDSQEFATYLLDALHEDTNRVTKKPYVEKPEKDEDESDNVAAKNAWDLHLQREDSRVLENFMGQIKSRVQCCKDGCGRVSTTFDPFMYLSVPIPGSTERTVRATFVPLGGGVKKNLSVTLSKAATFTVLITKVAEQLMTAGFSANGKPFAVDDFCVCDVWNHDVFAYFLETDECSKIRENDVTHFYQLKPTSEVVKAEAIEESGSISAEDDTIAETLSNSHRPLRYKVDGDTSIHLGKHEEWKGTLENYTKMPNANLVRILNQKRGTNAERFDFYTKLDDFVETCTRESDKASNKRAREEVDGAESQSSPLRDHTISADSEFVNVCAEEDNVPAVLERSEASQTFKEVKNRYDLAVLEFCASKLKRMIVDSIDNNKKKVKGGCLIVVLLRRLPSAMVNTSYTSKQEKNFGHPILLRIPATMTVYGLREALAKCLAPVLRLGSPDDTPGVEGLPSESDVIPMEGDSDRGDEEQPSPPSDIDSMNVSSPVSNSAPRDPALLILRQLPLVFRRSGQFAYRSNEKYKSFGATLEEESPNNGSSPINLASPSDEEEQKLVAELVGASGQVCVDWPAELCDRIFDEKEFDSSEEIKDPEEEVALTARNEKAAITTTLLDCVAKYCQQEQLEETEMWYCNRCKEHVRAWKQFNIYQAPPVLIIHLKRFQYTASSNRRDKINTFIDFPLTGLDLSGTVMHWADGEKPVYDCYAVSNHFGGLGGGHYTAFALNNDGVWCTYDDSRITEGAEPKDVVSASAYVVYYRRRDIVVNDDFLEGLPTPAIVADHMDSKVGTPSESSSHLAVQSDDMDVDIQHSDGYSNASTKTSMEGEADSQDEADGFTGESSDYYNSADNSDGANYPLQ